MQYVDLTLLIIIAGAVLLLVMILVSFILNSRRSGAIEEEVERLRSVVGNQAATLDEVSHQVKLEQDGLSRRFQGLDMGVRALERSHEDLRAEISRIRGELSAAIERFLSPIMERARSAPVAPEPVDPMQQVLNLLREGRTAEEVSVATRLPRSEIEMMARVNGITLSTPSPRTPAPQTQAPAPSAVPNPQAPAPAAARPLRRPPSAVATAPSVRPQSTAAARSNPPRPQAAQPRPQSQVKPAPAPTSAPTVAPEEPPKTPVAGFKARSAYGMSSLKRRR